jgi:hypothetical protein
MVNLFGPVTEGILRQNRRLFTDPWSTAAICCDYDPRRKLVCVAMNREYKIYLIALDGRIIKTMRRSWVPVKADLRDIEAAFAPILSIDPAGGKELLSVYPSTYATINRIQIIKNGNILVFRITGIRKLEVDVFDADGTFKCTILPSKGISFENASFNNKGFSIRELKGDYFVYNDYVIKNIKNIFD